MVRVERGNEVEVSGPVRTALVRIFQETVHNSIRHGRARQIEASLAADAGRIELLIADNGAGFDLAAPTAGTGIKGLRSRVGEVGGSISIESTPGSGTRVHVELPLTRGARAL
jgi:signal transduction histidine kinase